MGNKPEDRNKIYRLSLLEDRTHKKIRSIRFSKFKMIAAIVTFLVVTIGAIFSIIAFTPVRTLIPGYPDARTKTQAVENAIRIDSLETVIMRWELYSENLASVLAGESTISLDSLIKDTQTKYLKDVSAEQINLQDSLLRKKIEEK